MPLVRWLPSLSQKKTNTALNIAHTRGTKHILSRSRIDAVCFDKDANDYGYI